MVGEQAGGSEHNVGTVQTINVLDFYVHSAPHPQNALDIFRGEWLSKLPGTFAELQAGNTLLFEDARIDWGVTQLGGVRSQRVLELGPLEAGHSYMLEQHGADSVTAIEANTRAYLKCLIIKELMGLERVRFLCGDFVEYLRTAGTTFDICIASGVLYHMREPAELVALISKVARRVLLWTHYYDHAIISSNPALAPTFPTSKPSEYQGFAHTLYQKSYGVTLDQLYFCGGGETYSHWMTLDDILACMRYFGFDDINTNFHQPDHPNGPAIAITAVRRES
jgi:hypothetical protein